MAHYFDKDPQSDSRPFYIEVPFKNKSYSFLSDHGVFSKGHFDYASKFLAETITLKENSHVCDLGCGIGVIGLLLEQETPIHLTMIDINERAITCAIKNKEAFNSKAFILQNDGLTGLDQTFDAIISNPPVRIGKVKLYELVDEALHHLNEKGRFYFVMHKKHGVDSFVRNFKKDYQVEIIAQSKGFKVGFIAHLY